MALRLLALFSLLLAAAGCDKADPLGCAANSDCPTGHICLSERCSQVCDDSSQCPRGYVCSSDGVCARGAAGAPRIDEVMGNGSTACASSPGGRCFADGLILTGESLDGATFGLESTTGGQSYPLALGAGPTAAQVTVLLPANLVAGEFTLVAQNDAGEDQVGVRILQGEPGPALTGQEMLQRINTEGTSTFVIARMPAPDDMILHINNGTIKIDPDLLPASGTAYDGNDIVGLLNDAGTTLSIDAARLATPDALMQRVNSSTTLLDANNLPVANDLIGRINEGNGTVKLSSTVLPTASGGGPTTGDEVVALLNDGGTTDIAIGRLPTGTTGGTVAVGNHAHAGYAATVHNHSGADITSGTVPFAQLPTGTTASSVAIGNHSHAGTSPPLYYQRTAANRATDVDIPLATIAAYCGDTNGCTIRLGFQYSGYDATTDIPATVWGPPCPTQINANGDWATTFFCQQSYAVLPSGSFRPYTSDVFGVDGNSNTVYPRLLGYMAYDEGSGLSQIVCELSEVGRQTDTGDALLALHFRMTNNTPTHFDNASRTCELVIED